MNNKMKKAVILLIWLALWQVTAFFVNNSIYFASPIEVASELCAKVKDIAFWQSVAGSLIRIVSGFLFSFLLAFLVSFIAYRYELVRDFLSPAVTFLNSVPIISMMVVFPNIYLNMLSGLKNADRRLIEMAEVFKLGRADRMLWIYRPAYLSYLHSAVSVSLGMCFKSGIAAEVIGLPHFSAGEQLYRDKIYLNTAGVFAWVIVILLVSSLTERLIRNFLKLLSGVPASCLSDTGIVETGLYRENQAYEKIPAGESEFTINAENISRPRC